MEIVLIALLTIFAGLVGTVGGFGTSTIMVPVLALFFPLPATLLLVGTIHWFSNIWKMLLFGEGFDWKFIASFGIPAAFTSYLGASLVLEFPQSALLRVVGGVLVGYVVFLFLEPQFRLRKTAAAASMAGLCAGFLPGLVGIGGEVRSVFLAAFDLKKSLYIFTSGVLGFIVDSTRLATYFATGIRVESLLLWGLLMFIPASFVGAYLARRVVDRIPQRQFRMVVAVFLLAVGVKLLFSPQ